MSQSSTTLLLPTIFIDLVFLHAKVESTSQRVLSNRNSSSAGCPQELRGICAACDSNGECLDCSKMGVQLPDCAQPCSSGFFGLNCKRQCNPECLNSECNPNTGYCLACRDIGYSLPTCTLPCMPGTFGMHCQNPCPSPCRENCDRQSGFCTSCDVGSGPHCTVNCALALHRDSCGVHCPEKCVGWCNTTHRRCSMCSPGFKSPHCREYCDTGTFGSQCNQNCSKRCRDSVCNPITGECTGCIDGYVGRWCNGRCVEGLHGPGCMLTCPETCLENLCHAETGACVNCQKGFTGRLCDRLCESGTYGARCTQPCPAKCRWPCDPVTGECQECMAGYHGNTCNKTCAKGTYGPRCNRTCPVGCLDEICDHETGDCVECKSFFHGPRCKQFAQKKTRPFEVVVYTVLSLLTPVVLLGVVMACYKNCISKENKSILQDVKMAEEKYIQKPRQNKKEQRIKINKGDIHVVEENPKTATIHRGLRREMGPPRPQPLKTHDALMINKLKRLHMERRFIPANADEDTRAIPTALGEPKQREPIDSEINKTAPDHMLLVGPGSVHSDVAAKKPLLKTCENQTWVAPDVRQGRQTKQPEERAEAATAKQDSDCEADKTLPPEDNKTWQIATPSSQLSKEKGSVVTTSFVDGSPVASIAAPGVELKSTKKTSGGSSFVKNTKPYGVVASLSRTNIFTEPECSLSCVPNAPYSEWPAPPAPQTLLKSESAVFPTPRDSHAKSPSLQNMQGPHSAKSPSLNNIRPQHTMPSTLQSESPMLMSAHGRLQLQPAKSPSLVGVRQSQTVPPAPPLHSSRPESQYTLTASLYNSPQSRDQLLPPSQFNRSSQDTSSAFYQPERQSQFQMSSTSSQSRADLQTSQSSHREKAPHLQHRIPSATQTRSESHRTMSPSPQHPAQSQRALLQSQQDEPHTQDTVSRSLQSMPEPHRMSHIPPQHAVGLQGPKSYLAMPSTLGYRSQSQHTVPSPPRSFLPTQGRALSQSVKRDAPSKPESSSSLRPHNTLSSVLTMPTMSNSWSGQQPSRGSVHTQGRSSTLTSGSGLDKHLSSTSASMLADTQDMEQCPAGQAFRGFPNDASEASRDAKKPASVYRVIQEEELAASLETEGSGSTGSGVEEHLEQDSQEEPPNTQELPLDCQDTGIPGVASSSGRRRARSAYTDQDEPAPGARSQSKSPGLVRCATTRVQVQAVGAESWAGARVNPLPTPPSQGRAVLRPVVKRSRQRAQAKSRGGSDDGEHAQSPSQSD